MLKLKSNLQRRIFGAAILSIMLLLGFGSIMVSATDVTQNLDVSAVVLPNPHNGGSGVIGQITTATITLSGFTFPNARLTLLKDGAVSTTLIANPDGTFVITINNLIFGNYQLSIYSEDVLGNQSSPHTINVAAFSSQPYTFSNIIIPPTISLDKQFVKTGETYKVFGYAPRGAIVDLDTPPNQRLGTTIADANGYYEIFAKATALGIYGLRTRASLFGQYSYYSKPLFIKFYAATPTPAPSQPSQPGQQPPPQYGLCVDYNHDRRVNLIDFSILLFWYGKDKPPGTIDCNGDAEIDIKDFSLLMYYWTG